MRPEPPLLSPVRRYWRGASARGPPAALPRQRAGNQPPGLPPLEVVTVRAPAAPPHRDNVSETLRGQQADGRAVAFQDGVGCYGGTVDEGVEIRPGEAVFLEDVG